MRKLIICTYRNLKTYLLIFTIAILSNLKCTKPCQDLNGLERSVMLIYPYNLATNSYLYLENESLSLFKRDSLKIINEDGRRFPLVSFLLQSDPRDALKRFYSIKISPAFLIPDDNNAFNAERTRKIYLSYNYNTVDTLTLIFKARKTKCDKSEYEYLKVFYKNNLIASIQNKITIDFTLNR